MGQRSAERLTRDLCERAEKREEQYELWDAEIAGFGLRVMPSGVKSFIVRYRADGGGRTAKRRTYTLGRFGALTLDQARKSAKTILGAVANGQDCGSAPKQGLLNFAQPTIITTKIDGSGVRIGAD